MALILASPAMAGDDPGDETAQLQKKVPEGKIVEELARIGYSGNESLRYDVSWTGGIKIGELYLEVTREGSDEYRIGVRVTTENGALEYIYPIEDRFETWVSGREKLPYRYEAWQKEGYSYRAHRLTRYDQSGGRIIQQKNGKDNGVIEVEGKTNNEFSSFFNSRLMAFDVGRSFLVPTFADRKRADVVVNVRQKTSIEHKGLGKLTCFEIMPVLTFKGLYDKQGDTVIWYTDDRCRVPVRIRSKILIGSLTAELVGYSNAACKLYELAYADKE